MNILIIITDYGSFNNFLGELAINLQALNHQVHVICGENKVINYKDKFDYSKKGVKFHYFQFTRNYNFIAKYQNSIKIQKLINKIQPDIINLHFTTGIFETMLSGKLNYTTIGVFHGLGFSVVKNWIQKQIFKAVETFCCNKLSKIYVINNDDYKILIKNKIKNIYKYNSFGVGCDINKFNPSKINEIKKISLKNKLNISKNDKILMFTGRYVFFKGFDLVIQSFKYIEKVLKIQNIKLILLGGIDDAHPTGLSKEDELYYKNSLNIHNIGFTSEVQDYLSISDLFVFPSFKEGMPVCIMEAQAMGVPVITLNARGCNDIIKHNFNGILLNKDIKPQFLAESIIELVNNQELMSQFKINALKNRDLLDRSNFINETIQILINNATNNPHRN